ncbi:acidic mammalian chitinase-like isoform X2 [Anthonomus grandis grandis]|uniref:acidic mammalian chitinase-like isoform X2 n=1 Tax=Anthonomus grandis grandis TaxID=2921223 RepID=UPI00216528CA|nr:acidic mammalian chitinase-like isoform X2 [Anthonomus grandis grandis]
MVKVVHFSCLMVAVVFFGINLTEAKYIGGYYWSGASIVLKCDNLNASLLTHLYYAFVTANEDGSLTVQNAQKGYANDLLSLKSSNPDLKLLFSFVADNNGSFSKVVADKNLRKTFVDNALELVQQYQYDGIDFDWEFPQDKDKVNFTALLNETYTEFKKYNYQVTAAVRAIPVYKNSGYDIPEVVKYLDVINIMTYDYFGSWSNTTGQNSPLYPSSLDSAYEREYLNIEASIKNWVEAGAPKEKLAVGLPFYGRTFTLADPTNHGVHAPSLGGGSPLAPTYYQILKNYQNFTTEWNDEQKSPYKYSNTTWLAYENERSIAIKTRYAVENGMQGVFLWHLGCDDIYGEYSYEKQVLLHTINKVYRNK